MDTLTLRAGFRRYGAAAALAILWVAAAPGYEVREIWQEVALSESSFQFTGASCAATTITIFLPTLHFTEASLNMLGEAAADRIEEVELHLRQNPDQRLSGTALPGLRQLTADVAARYVTRFGETPVLRTNANLLHALDRLHLTRYGTP